MARALSRVRFTASLVDALGIRGNVFSHIGSMPNATTVDDIVKDLAQWGTLLDAVTTGGFVKLGAEILPPLADAGSTPTYSLTTSPDADSRMNEVGNWSFHVTGSAYRYTQSVESLSDAVLSGSEINPANGDVTAWQGFFASDPPTMGGHWTNQDGLALAALFATFLSERKNRRRLHELSYNTSP